MTTKIAVERVVTQPGDRKAWAVTQRDGSLEFRAIVFYGPEAEAQARQAAAWIRQYTPTTEAGTPEGT